MTFPTTSVLDDFTRADEDPLSDSGAWGTGPIFGGGPPALKLVSDVATAAATPDYASSWWGTSITGDQEVWATIDPDAESVAQGTYVMCCITDPDTGTPTGYQLEVVGFGSEMQLVRIDTGGGTTINVYSQGVGPGDSIGLSVRGGTLRTHYKPGSDPWTLVGTDTDSTYADGYIGIGVYDNDSAPAFTAFGGGASTDDTSDGGGGGDDITPVVAQHGLYLTPTDLTGAPLGAPGKPAIVKTPTQPQVTIPFSDSRTGTIAVSMYDKIAGALAVATSAVKVLYVNPKGDDVLVLNGIVLSKTDDFDGATTTAQLHDPTIRLKKRNLGYGHISIELGYGETIDDGSVDTYTGGEFNGVNSDYGIPLDGRGLRLMMYDAAHGTSDRGVSGVPGLHIRPGNDDSTPQPGYGEDGVPPPGVIGFTATATEGSATLTDVSFVGATWTGEGSPDITDILEYMRLVGPAVDDVAVVPEYGSVVSASGTSIVMNLEAAASVTGGTFTAEDAIYCQLSRGDCVYDDVTDIVQAQGSFECNWEPIDADHLGPSGDTWESGQMAELYTANRIGSDRSQGNTESNVPVVFVHGIGGFHLTHAPDADSLITYVVEVGPGGPADPLDIYNKVTYEADTISTYGIWEAWEQATSAGTGDTPISNALLTDRADAVLTAYQNPPQFITATIDSDVVGGTGAGREPYCYGTDFFLGDTVTVYAKKGSVTLGPLAVRITQIGITRVDENGNCQLDLTMVPYLTANPGVGPDDL